MNPNQEHRFQYNLALLSAGSATVSVQQFVGNTYQTLATANANSASGSYTFAFTPTSSTIRILVSSNTRFALNNLYLDRDHVDTLVESYALHAGGYRYGFQAQEKDDEVKGAGNSVNYTYRMHDPRIGRFFALDPLASKYPHNSPYSFSGNKVIHCIELEGLEEYEIYNNNGILILVLKNVDSDFIIRDFSSGTLVERKSWYYKAFIQQMKGSYVNKFANILYVPLHEKQEFRNRNSSTLNPLPPEFAIHSTNWEVGTKKMLDGHWFSASEFKTAEEAFDAFPMDQAIYDDDGNMIRDKTLPDYYDYVDVFITAEYSRDDVLKQLAKHGVDVKNKEINFISKPINGGSASNFNIEVTFGIYE